MKHPTKQFAHGMAILALTIIPLLHSGCAKTNDRPPDGGSPRDGYVTGTVKDGSGKPLEGTHIIIDHSIFFNSNITALTNNQGNYAIKVPTGSWYAFAKREVAYHGKMYSFYLHPDNPAGFGGEGAVRNFVWKLTGTMPEPLSGHYGGLITIDNRPGVYIEASKIDFVLTPTGPLIDGSQGEVIRVNAEDAHAINDIPIGRYHLTATYEGMAVKFRRWNTDGAFKEVYDLHFEPQITGHCENCAKLEYDWQP